MIQPHPNFQKRILVSPIKKTKTGFTDLHMHSLLSDGALPPVQLVKIAAARGLKSIAITDHDNIDSYDIALQTAKELNVELISGIEISAVHNGKDIHILGYFCDVTNLALHMELQEPAKRRLKRGRALNRKLKSFGCRS